MTSHSIRAIECNKRVESFFAYARERQTILLQKRAGALKPWTTDPILQSYRFCNIFREDDKVTEWFKQWVRHPYRNHPHIVFATMVMRYFNRIETCEILLGRFGDSPHAKSNLFINWEPAEVRRRLKGVSPLVSAAYMCTTPWGKTKLEGLIDIIDRLWEARDLLYRTTMTCGTMEDLVEFLQGFYYMGNFRAYECACDLQYTDVFHPTDTLSWANPGPGAERGLARIITGEAKWPDGQRRNREQQIDCMRDLLAAAGQVSHWPGHWPKWDMRTVEHTLCEFDKYERVRLGEGKPKQKYDGGV